MSSILLLLTVLLPIVFAVVIRLLKVQGKVKEILNLIVVVITSLLVLLLLVVPPTESFHIFDFNEKLNVSLKLDGIGKIFAGMVALLWPFAYLYAVGYMKGHDEKKNYSMFYVITYGVVLGISFAANLITMYFFYELLTLVTIPLIIQPMSKEAKRATRYYLYISLFGSTLALIGIIMLIHNFNTCDFVNVFSSDVSVYSSNSTLAQIAYLLMFFGFGVKAAIFPLHGWLPRAGVAPTPTTALLHAVAVVKSGAFAIIRVIYSVIGVEVLSGTPAQIISMMFVAFTIVFGSSMALKQVHMKRRFAYSTVANISYILLAATMMSEFGLYAAMLHLLFHSFAKIAIFFVAGGLMHNANVNYVDQVDGLAKKMPVTFALYILAGLSIVGIPMFAGFISKWEIANAAINVNTWYSYIGIAALLISALLTAIYVIDIIIRAYFKKPNEYNAENYEVAHECNYKFIVPIAAFSILSLVLGLFATPLMELLSSLLIGGGF